MNDIRIFVSNLLCFDTSVSTQKSHDKIRFPFPNWLPIQSLPSPRRTKSSLCEINFRLDRPFRQSAPTPPRRSGVLNQLHRHRRSQLGGKFTNETNKAAEHGRAPIARLRRALTGGSRRAPKTRCPGQDTPRVTSAVAGERAAG